MELTIPAHAQNERDTMNKTAIMQMPLITIFIDSGPFLVYQGISPVNLFK
jgi:hypothetical protein